LYKNPYNYRLPYRFRKFKKFKKLHRLSRIKKFLQSLIKTPIYITISNVFNLNRIHSTFFWRLKKLFNRFKNYKFAANILGIFSIVLRSKGADFLARILSTELAYIGRRKRNKVVWQFIKFVKKLVKSIEYFTTAIHGIKIQLKGRFKGSNRSKRIRVQEGAVPLNTIRALIDYSFSPALSVNGSFGIKIWICYRSGFISNKPKLHRLIRD
jgi:hypothetical protein